MQCSPFIVRSLVHDVVDSVGGFDLEGDGLEDLHSTTKTEDDAERRLLDVVVGKTVTILHPAAGRIQVLLIRRNARIEKA